MEIDKLLERIREEEKAGRVVFLTFDGFKGSALNSFVQQPADGILYDLNRDRVTTITLAKADEIGKRWVNDYAVAVVIEYLHAKLSKSEAENKRLRETLSKVYVGTDDRRLLDLIDKALESEGE